MPKLFTLSEMAEELDTTPKSFSADVTARGIPFYPVGKRKRFDPIEVKAYLRTTEIIEKSNVAKFPVIKKGKTKIISSRFAEA